MTKAEELINKHLDRLDANNIIGKDGNIYKGFINAVNEALTLTDVVASLPSKDEKLIGNMCLSFRHDFGLLPKLIQEDLKKDCKNWLISYENNRN